TQELAERRRTWRIWHRTELKVKACRFRLARDEKPIGFSWHTDFQNQRPVCRLLNLLNPSVPQNRSDLFNHLSNIRCIERHQLSGVYEGTPLRCGSRAVSHASLRESPRTRHFVPYGHMGHRSAVIAVFLNCPTLRFDAKPCKFQGSPV